MCQQSKTLEMERRTRISKRYPHNYKSHLELATLRMHRFSAGPSICGMRAPLETVREDFFFVKFVMDDMRSWIFCNQKCPFNTRIHTRFT